MSVVVALLTLLLLAAVVAVVSHPLRLARREAPETALRAELEAAREAKYREIRDAELDYRTGKMSDADYHAVDSGLRAEAVEILRRLDALEPEGGADGGAVVAAADVGLADEAPSAARASARAGSSAAE